MNDCWDTMMVVFGRPKPEFWKPLMLPNPNKEKPDWALKGFHEDQDPEKLLASYREQFPNLDFKCAMWEIFLDPTPTTKPQAGGTANSQTNLEQKAEGAVDSPDAGNDGA